MTATALLAALAFAAPGCGGGGGGQGPDGAGQGLQLITFIQNGVNNLSLNQILEFRFSEPVDPSTVHSASMQVREGPSFGRAVNGVYRVVGSTVFFEPTLPGRCDLTDAGFQPGKTYRITLVGFPEQFSIKNLAGESGPDGYIPGSGQPLQSTMNFEFKTRLDTDPLLFIDQIAATSPVVTTTSPQNGTPIVVVQADNKIVITFSENLDPCTVNATNIRFQEWERGGVGTFVDPGAPGGPKSGFTTLTPSTVDDGNIGNPFSWGSSTGGAVAPSPQLIRSNIVLTQSFSSTVVTITPEFGRFPENALCVVELTFGIKDLGGSTLVPLVFAFTTENLASQQGTYQVKFLGETPIDPTATTADVNTARSPGRAQGWWLLAGDGDNGANMLIPGLPTQAPTCTTPLQQNDGVKDNLDANTANITLDTGLTLNTCPNGTDGSVAVVYEFQSFRIRSGRHVFVVGENPAIILVQGAVNIDANGRLHIRSSTATGTAQNNGQIGNDSRTVDPAGGAGLVGGGDGGKGYRPNNAVTYADSGMSPAGSPSGQNVQGGVGGGLGGVQATKSSFGTGFGSAGGGGGGGHSAAGTGGGTVQTTNNPFKGPATGTGGAIVGTLQMFLPSAGGGGGGGGSNTQTASTFIGYDGGGGGGGGGGGFIDFTSASSITVNGIINAQGGTGGSGEGPHNFYLGAGGAGGGAGGGVRMLTPGTINITGAQILCTGGANGIGYTPSGGTANHGGVGGVGRIALEDSDGIIDGLNAATLTPAPGGGPTGGFWTGPFDPTRFAAGARTPALTTGVFFVGPANPDYNPLPVVADFVANIPSGSDRGVGKTSILIEAQGFQLLPDGTYNPGSATGWRTVGHITHSGLASSPNWVNGNPPVIDIPTLPPGNPGGASSINMFDTCEFLQLRITFYLNNTMGPFDPGPYLDDWTIRFDYNQ
jgi:hypothetical protein